MFRLAVCDDDREELTRVSALLSQYQASRGTILSFDLFRSAFWSPCAIQPMTPCCWIF